MNDQLQITESAWEHITNIIDNAPEPVVGFRAGVKGGGCSGLQYSFTYAETIDEDDIVYEHNTTRVVVDPISIMYLNGAVIDWIDGLASSGFTIVNPNAQTRCGCGHSFAVF